MKNKFQVGQEVVFSGDKSAIYVVDVVIPSNNGVSYNISLREDREFFKYFSIGEDQLKANG